ncbi:hypothetical protein K443DRAFT_676879 [Laccaria amethystina LaAM-08-1]|uniref:Unplaced genomic scaffold K443scaffold_47, whole genome shotgun sequence n=1 Tax=Laccaria amethystina LaAM-08-1 TaxID=1095629 RepID=A0A0C9WV21_9AGAR|nr:hypothetical protein K443DRAFT_676879 [Laccaria amethystina LaAM-08-1]
MGDTENVGFYGVKYVFNGWARLGRDVEASLVVPCRIDIGTSAVRQIVSRTYLAATTLRLEDSTMWAS